MNNDIDITVHINPITVIITVAVIIAAAIVVGYTFRAAVRYDRGRTRDVRYVSAQIMAKRLSYIRRAPWFRRETEYFLTICLNKNDIVEFSVGRDNYMASTPGDRGRLAFSKETFVSFDRQSSD